MRIMRACREQGIRRRGLLPIDRAPCMSAGRRGDRRPARRRPRATCDDAIVDAAARSEPTRSIPATASSPRAPGLPRPVASAGVDLRRAAARSDRGDGLEDRRARAHDRAGVPVVPGATPADQSDAGVRAAALAIGLPVVVKASAGGGGKGMRVVTALDALDESIAAARREATRAFGDGTLYVERRVERPRHVEIRIFADAHGGCVHLFERECSIQRRHQKIVEETPSPALTPAVRARRSQGGRDEEKKYGEPYNS